MTLRTKTWEWKRHYPIRNGKRCYGEGHYILWTSEGIQTPEALLKEDAMWWFKNAENLTLVFPGGKSCALSQEKSEECQSLLEREIQKC